MDEYLVRYYRALEHGAQAAAARAKSDEVRLVHLQFARDYALAIVEEQEKQDTLNWEVTPAASNGSS